MQITHHKGKGSQSQLLPNRHALNELTKGDMSQRTINNYAKESPSIAQTGPSLTDPEQR